RLSQPAAVRGSTRPAHGQIRSLILSTRKGALHFGSTLIFRFASALILKRNYSGGIFGGRGVRQTNFSGCLGMFDRVENQLDFSAI
ncbi:MULTISPECIES: hypothetical protein, partial [Bosea]|uniref:hypothetical protein n=1 Tax=Bosea TaxID=85413 RepID=UPI00286D188B